MKVYKVMRRDGARDKPKYFGKMSTRPFTSNTTWLLLGLPKNIHDLKHDQRREEYRACKAAVSFKIFKDNLHVS